jgi:hypothetical protein
VLFPDQSGSDVCNPPPGLAYRFRSPAAMQWRVLTAVLIVIRAHSRFDRVHGIRRDV